MVRVLIGGLTLATLVGLSAATMAADMVEMDVPVAAPVEMPTGINWTGGYVGAFGAYAFGGETTIAPQGSNFDTEGFFGGVTVGYNYQFANNVVLGLEGDIGIGDIYGDQVRNVLGIVNVYGEVEADYLATVRGRVGYAAGRLLPFVSGGLAFAKLDVNTGLAADRANPVFYDDAVQFGYTVGAGLEYAVTDNLSVKAEYQYVDLGSKTYTRAALGPFNPATSQEVDFSTNVVKLGVNFRF